MLRLLTSDEISPSDQTNEKLQELIRERLVYPHFQPILDMHSGEVFSYEVLTRCGTPFSNTAELFSLAHRWDLSWELENVTRMKAFETIASFSKEQRQKRYFFNVSPYIFSDPRFVSGTTVSALKELGLDPGNVVFEITETATVEDYDRFEALIRYYVNEGFKVALDDFGSGHSGMVTLAAMTPHFLKIDMALIQGISRSTYKQKLVRAIATFAQEVESECIAEGIENIEDLETLLRLGIRFAQGFLIGKPSPIPLATDPAVAEEIERLIEYRNRSRFSVDTSISKMVIRPRTYSPNEITCEELDMIFQRDAALEHIVIVDGDRPCGILTRQHFYSVIGGRFGYSLFQKKPADRIAKTEMLCLDEHLDLRTAGRLAMARQQEELYDPVISIDGHGRFIGTITMKQVINKAFDMEIKIATGANPLTQLPGNMIIGFWLEEAVGSPVFTVVYCDLDNFKAYNDAYGFPKGDEALQLTARTLNDFISLHAMEANLGHIGGDDFIIVSDTRIGGEKLQLLCDDFDERRRELFTLEDRERGWYKTMNRKGRAVKVPLVSMSLAVVTEANFTSAVHPGQLGQVAALIKKEIKARNLERGASGFLVDRRVYG